MNYDDVYSEHMHCNPEDPSHNCSCHISPPCENCVECPAYDPDWNGWE